MRSPPIRVGEARLRPGREDVGDFGPLESGSRGSGPLPGPFAQHPWITPSARVSTGSPPGLPAATIAPRAMPETNR